MGVVLSPHKQQIYGSALHSVLYGSHNQEVFLITTTTLVVAIAVSRVDSPAWEYARQSERNFQIKSVPPTSQ